MDPLDDGTPSVPPTSNPYLTGAPVMDAEHLRLFGALERLEESLHGPHPLETLGERLMQLEALTLEHFRNEEDFLASQGYPHLDLHRAEHQGIIDRCRDLLEDFIGPDSPPLFNLAIRLKILFFRHIEQVDRDYAAFLERGGLTAGPADPA